MKNILKALVGISILFTAIPLVSVTPETVAKLEEERKKNESYLDKLPLDLQRYLIPLVTSTDTFEQAIKNVQNLASTNKYYYTLINSPQSIILLINLLGKKLIKSINVGHALNRKQGVEWEVAQKIPFSGVKNKEVQDWLNKKSIEHALIKAAGNGDIATVEALIGIQVNPNAKDFLGNTALDEAAKGAYEGIVSLLLQAGADPNLEITTPYARTKFIPLLSAMYAAQTDNVAKKEHLKKISLKLLNAGSDVNYQIINGTTPLIAAVDLRLIDLVEPLLKAGANPNIKNNRGNTALYYAKLQNLNDTINLLKKYGAIEN